MINKAIKVQRHVTAIAEVSLLTGDDNFDVLEYAENTPDLEWDEVDVITHYKIVENYA